MRDGLRRIVEMAKAPISRPPASRLRPSSSVQRWEPRYQILVLLADVAITAAQLSRPTAADNKTERGWPDGMRQSM